jgi:putative oxidoreductase
MRIVVWIFQILLALAFLAHGLMMLFPPASIAVQMDAAFPRWFQVFVGVSEVLAFIGLTLPPLAHRYRWLISWAAAGLMIIMVLATAFHLYRNEISSALTTLVLLVMSTIVFRVRRREYPAFSG